MKKLLLLLFLIPNLVMADDFLTNPKYKDGPFIREDIGVVTINIKLIERKNGNDQGILYIKHGERLLHHHICDSFGCDLMVTSSGKPYLAIYDGAIIPEGKGARMDGKWNESQNIHNMSTIKKIPVFSASYISAPKNNFKEKRFVGFVNNSYGNRWGGAELILVNVDTGTLITRALELGKTK